MKFDFNIHFFPSNHISIFEILVITGRVDQTTTVNITVSIKYTTEFASTLGVWINHGLYLLSAFTMMVTLSVFVIFVIFLKTHFSRKTLQEAFDNSQTLIRFKLKCIDLIELYTEETVGDFDEGKLEEIVHEEITPAPNGTKSNVHIE